MENTPNPQRRETLYLPEIFSNPEFAATIREIEDKLNGAYDVTDEELEEETNYIEVESGLVADTDVEILGRGHLADSEGTPTSDEEIISHTDASYCGFDIIRPLSAGYKVVLVCAGLQETADGNVENTVYFIPPAELLKFVPKNAEATDPYDSEVLRTALDGHASRAAAKITSPEYVLDSPYERRRELERLAAEACRELLATYGYEEVALYAREYYTIRPGKKNWDITRHEQANEETDTWEPLIGSFMGCTFPELYDPDYNESYLELRHDYPSIAFQSSDGERLFLIPITDFVKAYEISSDTSGQ